MLLKMLLTRVHSPIMIYQYSAMMGPCVTKKHKDMPPLMTRPNKINTSFRKNKKERSSKFTISDFHNFFCDTCTMKCSGLHVLDFPT